MYPQMVMYRLGFIRIFAVSTILEFPISIWKAEKSDSKLFHYFHQEYSQIKNCYYGIQTGPLLYIVLPFVPIFSWTGKYLIITDLGELLHSNHVTADHQAEFKMSQID